MSGLLLRSGGLGVLPACLLAAACSAPARSAARATAAPGGTAEMAAVLKARAAAVDPSKTQFLVNDRRAKLFAEQLQSAVSTEDRIRLRLGLARELLNAGQIPESLQALDALQEELKANAPEVWDAQGRALQVLRATAYLRMGEEQNCHQGNTPDSCLLPLRG